MHIFVWKQEIKKNCKQVMTLLSCLLKNGIIMLMTGTCFWTKRNCHIQVH
jgi:hypothetical protein